MTGPSPPILDRETLRALVRWVGSRHEHDWQAGAVGVVKRPDGPVIGSPASQSRPEAARRLNIEFCQVEGVDRAQRVGQGGISKARRQVIEPRLTIALYLKECSDCIVPPLLTATSILRPSVANDWLLAGGRLAGTRGSHSLRPGQSMVAARFWSWHGSTLSRHVTGYNV
jgi:hypothetical protein